MREAGFPQVGQHRAWDNRYRRRAAELVGQHHADGDSNTLRLRVSLAIEDWLLAHIQVMDASLAAFLRTQRGATVIRFPDVQTLKAQGALPQDFDEVCLAVGT
jgi:hemerythrin